MNDAALEQWPTKLSTGVVIGVDCSRNECLPFKTQNEIWPYLQAGSWTECLPKPHNQEI